MDNFLFFMMGTSLIDIFTFLPFWVIDGSLNKFSSRPGSWRTYLSSESDSSNSPKIFVSKCQHLLEIRMTWENELFFIQLLFILDHLTADLITIIICFYSTFKNMSLLSLFGYWSSACFYFKKKFSSRLVSLQIRLDYIY